MFSDDPTWGDRLDKWRVAYWRLQCERSEACKLRGEDESRVGRLRRELKAAEEALRQSDAKARELMQREKQMRHDGEKEGFRP